MIHYWWDDYPTSPGQLGSAHCVTVKEEDEKSPEFAQRNGLLVPLGMEPKRAKIGFY